jgi:hypothetical protein
VERFCEHSNETLGSVKCLEIFLVKSQLAISWNGLISMELVGWIVSRSCNDDC